VVDRRLLATPDISETGNMLYWTLVIALALWGCTLLIYFQIANRLRDTGAAKYMGFTAFCLAIVGNVIVAAMCFTSEIGFVTALGMIALIAIANFLIRAATTDNS
jgi:hypothetical protein